MRLHLRSRRLRRRWLISSLALAAVAATLTCTVMRRTSVKGHGGPEVSVLLTRSSQRIDLSIDGPFTVHSSVGVELARGKRLARGIITAPGPRTLDFNGIELDIGNLEIRSTESRPFRVDGKSYPGVLRVRVVEGRRLELVNVVDMETYVAGVLFAEMPSSFPTEALKVQSIAARSYARYQLDHGNGQLLPTESDQVYSGVGPRSELAWKIVRATRGQVLEVSGTPLCAYYSSTCGGATASSQEIFGERRQAALGGARCDFCRESQLYRWSRKLPLGEFLRCAGLPSTASIERLSTVDDPFGRSREILIGGKDWDKKASTANLRAAWNRDRVSRQEQLPSAWFSGFHVTAETVEILGRGFGHGVGMCQYGACGLARSGRRHPEILRHYYPGAQLVRRW